MGNIAYYCIAHTYKSYRSKSISIVLDAKQGYQFNNTGDPVNRRAFRALRCYCDKDMIMRVEGGRLLLRKEHQSWDIEGV